MFSLEICWPSSCMWVFHHIAFVWFLLQQAKAPAFVMSCHARIFFFFFSTMCSLHSLPAGSVCFGLLLCSILFFFSCLQSLILLAAPSHHCFHSVVANQRAGKNGYTPHFYCRSLQGALVWGHCVLAVVPKQKPTKRKEGCWERVLSGCLHCFVLCALALFYSSSPNWVWACLYMLTSWNF